MTDTGTLDRACRSLSVCLAAGRLTAWGRLIEPAAILPHYVKKALTEFNSGSNSVPSPRPNLSFSAHAPIRTESRPR
jgi:hypothetical protein